MGTLLADFRQKKVSRPRFSGLLAMLLLFCFAEYVFQINIPQVAFVAVAFLIALTGDADEIMAMCMCCIPLHNFFEFSFAILAGIGCYAVKYIKRIRLNYSIVPIVLMVIWELVHCFRPGLNLMQFGGGVIPWLLIAVLMCSAEEKFDYDFIVRAFAVTVAAICCMLFGKILVTSGFNLSETFANLYRLGVEAENEGLTKLGASRTSKVNANTLGTLCVLGASGLMQLRLAGRSKVRDAVFTVILLMFGIMTASKTFFFCLVFAVLLLVFSTEGSIGGKIKYIMGVLAIALAVLAVSYLIMPGVVEYFISRFYEEDFTTGRADHMVIYNEFILSNPDVLIYGLGLQNFGNRVLQFCEKAIHVPHNGIQELIIVWGLPGLAIFAALWVAMIVRSGKRCARQGLVNYIPLLVILLKVQAGQMVTSPYTMLVFSLAYLSMCAPLRAEAEYVEASEADIMADGLSLDRAVMALLRRWWIIALASVLCAAAAFGITRFAVTPMYQSSAQFYVNNTSALEGNLRKFISESSVFASRSMTSSYMEIMKTRSFLNKVIDHAGLDMDYAHLRGMISADTVNETEIFKVVVTGPDPVQAEQIANAIAELLPEHIADIINNTSTKVVDYAVVASGPSSPNTKVNAMVGFMLGFVLIALMLLLGAMRDRTVQMESDIEWLEKYPLLAVVPDLVGNEKGKEYYARDYK